MTTRWIGLAALLVSACGEAPPADPDAGVADAGPVMAVFDPAVLEGGGEFFDMPFPSELRTDDEGRPDLERFPRNRGLVADAIDALTHEGVSPITGVYFRFTGALDEASLPTPEEVASGASPVLLIDIDEASPDLGARLPAYVRQQREATTFWPANTLVVRPVPGVHLHPGRRYAVVLREGLTAGGEPIARNAAFDAIKTQDGSAIADAYGALFEDLEALDVARGPIYAATSFRVSDAARELDLARDFIAAQPLPTPSAWRVIAESPEARRLEADVEVYVLMEGALPFSAFGSGRIAFDDAGAPRTVRRETMRVGLTMPSGAPPEGGFPVVLYGHGTGGDHRTHFSGEGPALLELGVATLGFEAALHGDRGAGVDPGTLIVSNPVAAREMIRQSVIDAMLLYRLLAAAAFDDADAAVQLAPSPVLYMGHSQGSQAGGILLGVEPTIDAAFLSAGGAGAIITILERETVDGQPLSCLVAFALSEDCAALGEDHPALTLIVQPLLDAADPISFTHRFVRERPDGWAPLSLAMSEGDEDPYTPPRTVEALAASAGLPLVAPHVSASDPYRLLGTPIVTAPVQDNLTLPSGARATGGLLQWSGVGHYAIYELADARNRYVRFFEGAIAGTPTIAAPL